MPGTSARRVRADVHRAAEQQAMNTKRGRMTTVIRRSAQAAVLVAVAIGLSGCSYNKFTTQEEAIKAQWAQVQNQLQRRNDLIPNLVETVKGYAPHEEAVFKEIADSRSRLLAREVAGGDDPGREPADERARPAARGRRELSAPQGQRAVQPADGRALRHREPARHRADALQRAGPGIQHRSAGASRRTSPRRCSASRSIRSSRRRPRRRPRPR